MSTALERFFEGAGCRTQVELADFLGIRQSSISDAKKRGRIPAEWLLTLLRKKGISPDWVITGEGKKLMTPSGPGEKTLPHYNYARDFRLPSECTIEDLVRELFNRVSKNN